MTESFHLDKNCRIIPGFEPGRPHQRGASYPAKLSILEIDYWPLSHSDRQPSKRNYSLVTSKSDRLNRQEKQTRARSGEDWLQLDAWPAHKRCPAPSRRCIQEVTLYGRTAREIDADANCSEYDRWCQRTFWTAGWSNQPLIPTGLLGRRSVRRRAELPTMYHLRV